MRLQEGGQAQTALVELASGVDALYASSKAGVSRDLFAKLESLKQKASEEDLPGDWFLGTAKFQVFGHAWGKYPICIENEFGRLGFTHSEHLPRIRLQIRSSFLHAVGPFDALAWFSLRLGEIGVVALWTLSRLDLFVDVQGWDLQASDKHRFLSRASHVTTYEDQGRLTGFSFGGRKTRTITGRIYDKTFEIEKTKNDLPRDLWGERFRFDETVWRVEFEIHSRLLREFRISDVEDGLRRKDEIWAYCTDDWLTFRDPGSDGNKSRWPVSEVWQAVQKCSLRGDALGLDRVRDRELMAKVVKLIPPTRGYVSSLGAVLGADDLWTSINAVYEVLQDDEDRTGYSMQHRIRDKKRRFGL